MCFINIKEGKEGMRGLLAIDIGAVALAVAIIFNLGEGESKSNPPDDSAGHPIGVWNDKNNPIKLTLESVDTGEKAIDDEMLGPHSGRLGTTFLQGGCQQTLRIKVNEVSSNVAGSVCRTPEGEYPMLIISDDHPPALIREFDTD